MLKLISWNIAHRTEAWRTLVDSDADVALLQEAIEPPADIASRFDVGLEPWRTEGAGVKLRWRSAVAFLSKRAHPERIPRYRFVKHAWAILPSRGLALWLPLI
jgi:hypothetical protein